MRPTIAPPPRPLPSNEEEEELRLLMNAPTKEELRRLLQEIKNSSQGSPTGSATQEDAQNLFQDAQNPYS